ncbi:hypothetical protein ACSBR2_037702 [Camellia fascicularis]
MDPHLMEAARAGNINALYARIQSKPDILNGMNEEFFVETPLHVAASAGQTDFALEILKLKPSFGKKLNPEGLSPLHLALQNKHSETVRRLVKFDSELIRVKRREGLTPLHFVAKTDDQDDLLSEFLDVFSSSINHLTILLGLWDTRNQFHTITQEFLRGSAIAYVHGEISTIELSRREITELTPHHSIELSYSQIILSSVYS